MNIFNDPKLSAEEKAKARDKLLGTDPKQIKIFNEKYNNINKLVQTGTL
jgi:lipase chaperone LimK